MYFLKIWHNEERTQTLRQDGTDACSTHKRGIGARERIQKSSRERRKKREVNKAHEKKQVTTSETKTQMSKSKTQIVTIEGCKQDRKKNNKKKS